MMELNEIYSAMADLNVEELKAIQAKTRELLKAEREANKETEKIQKAEARELALEEALETLKSVDDLSEGDMVRVKFKGAIVELPFARMTEKGFTVVVPKLDPETGEQVMDDEGNPKTRKQFLRPDKFIAIV